MMYKLGYRNNNRMTGSMAANMAVWMFAFAVLLIAPSAFAADAPEWSTGFPRLVEKNALLQWNPVSGAAEYKVYRSEKKDQDLKLIETVKVNRHIDKGVPAGKTLYYYISAVADGKEGARSVAGAITTAAEKAFIPLKKPKMIGGHLKTMPDSSRAIAIRWEDAGGTGFLGVNVYRSTTKGTGYALIGSVPGDSYEDKDVKPGKTYYYVGSSVDANFKETKYSNEISVEYPAPKAASGKAKEEIIPTRMRAAKLLYRIPAKQFEDEKVIVPENALDVVVDEAVGHVYVASSLYGGVLVYDMSGRFQFGIRQDGVSGDKKIDAPTGIGLGPNGDIYVANYSNNEFSVFAYDGKPKEVFKIDISYIPGYEKRTAKIYDVAVGNDGSVYLTDPVTANVHAYSHDMRHMFDIAPTKNVNLNGPSYVVLDKQGDIVFVDAGYSVLRTFNGKGKYLNSIGKKGIGVGMLHFPTGLAVNRDGYIFSASGMSPNIQAFAPDGKFQYALGNEKLDGPMDVSTIKGIFIDSMDRIYVAEGLMNRVSVFQLTDKYMEVVPE